MPELPDLTVYVESLIPRIVGQTFEGVRLASPFLLRTAVPPLSAAQGKIVREVTRLGKRIIIELDDELFLVLHLMIAGRLYWHDHGKAIQGKIGLAAFDFSSGTLLLNEASQKKRAALYLVKGRVTLQEFDRGGLEVMDASFDEFQQRLLAENHTLKRSLTDPDLFAGIGNAYSDEILHRAKMSPVKMTRTLQHGEVERLFASTHEVLQEWIDRLRQEAGASFPEKVTAFRKDMAVHGKYNQPCPVCGTPVQRIVHAENESNYCPTCQTGGKLLADRALSRLLKADWPRSIEELEARKHVPEAGAQISGASKSGARQHR
jgi:formamidopyrimidine-DNA glycosylase